MSLRICTESALRGERRRAVSRMARGHRMSRVVRRGVCSVFDFCAGEIIGLV